MTPAMTRDDEMVQRNSEADALAADNSAAEESAAAQGSLVKLQHGQSLRLATNGSEQSLQLISQDGNCSLEIQITEQGPKLKIIGASAQLSVQGNLNIDADQLSLHGRDALSLSTGGDLKLQCDGDLESVAYRQTLQSTHGDVKVDANDDVRLQGERVRVNC